MAVLIIILLLIPGSLAGLYYLYRGVFCYPEGKRPDVSQIPEDGLHDTYRETMLACIREMECTDSETLSLTSFDGIRLCGRLYHINRKEHAPLLIFFHGYHGAPQWDGYGCFKTCKKQGINILMADQRCHGSSEGREITFGVKERYDCKAWAEYASDLFGRNTDLILAGVSMGAASILMASRLGLPENVKAIVADCAYTEPSAIIKETIRRLKLPVRPVYRLLALGAHLFGHFDLEGASALRAVETLKTPVLFIHGAKDSVVPLSMNETLYQNCTAPKKRLVIEKADHANCGLADYAGYETAVIEFLREACPAAR